MMPAITFASKLKDDGSLTISSEAVEELGLHPGNKGQVRVEATNGADQAALQAKFELFFENLDTIAFEKPTRFSSGDQTEAAFAEIMDKNTASL